MNAANVRKAIAMLEEARSTLVKEGVDPSMRDLRHPTEQATFSPIYLVIDFLKGKLDTEKENEFDGPH